MQILKWLAKIGHEQQRVLSPSPITKKDAARDEKVNSKEIVVYNDRGNRQNRGKRVEQTKVSCENLNLFYLLRRKDASKACFYHTLDLSRVGNFQSKQHAVNSVEMKKEDCDRNRSIAQKKDSVMHVGSKVLPITDSVHSSSSHNDSVCTDIQKIKTYGDKTKPVSRMKELLKWAAASRTAKTGNNIGIKGLYIRNRAALKSVPDNHQLNNESPKISLQRDLESCSSIYSAANPELSVAPSLKNDQSLYAASVNLSPSQVRDQRVAESGNWIRTDSEFVVLEL